MQVLKSGWHWSFGMLRRPELDTPTHHAYEEPCGRIMMTLDPDHRDQMHLDLVKAEDKTGFRKSIPGTFPPVRRYWARKRAD